MRSTCTPTFLIYQNMVSKEYPLLSLSLSLEKCEVKKKLYQLIQCFLIHILGMHLHDERVEWAEVGRSSRLGNGQLEEDTGGRRICRLEMERRLLVLLVLLFLLLLLLILLIDYLHLDATKLEKVRCVAAKKAFAQADTEVDGGTRAIKEFAEYNAWGPFTIALLKPDAVKKKIVEDLKDDLMMKGIRVRRERSCEDLV